MPFATQYVGDAAEQVVVVPDAQLHLHGVDLGDARASSIWPTVTLHRPMRSTRPSRFSAASARTLVASGTRGSGA